MKHEAAVRRSDAQVIATLVVIVAGLAGLIGMMLHDPSLDASRLVPAAHAAVVVPAVAPRPAPSVEVRAPTVTPEENWLADDASHGLRPDAAH